MTEKIVQIAVPLISIIAAIISAAVTYYFTKKNQIEANERRLKEQYYLAYIKAVSNMVLYNNSDEMQIQLADAQNQLLLIGSAEVVSCVMQFYKYVRDNGRKETFSKNVHDNLLTETLKAMRKDLYPTHDHNKGYPRIELSGRC